jgi:integrase
LAPACSRPFTASGNYAICRYLAYERGTNTCATLLLGKGVHAKFAQELLGHTTISIRLDTYSHVLPGMGNAAAGAMDEALG